MLAAALLKSKTAKAFRDKVDAFIIAEGVGTKFEAAVEALEGDICRIQALPLLKMEVNDDEANELAEYIRTVVVPFEKHAVTVWELLDETNKNIQAAEANVDQKRLKACVAWIDNTVKRAFFIFAQQWEDWAR